MAMSLADAIAAQKAAKAAPAPILTPAPTPLPITQVVSVAPPVAPAPLAVKLPAKSPPAVAMPAAAPQALAIRVPPKAPTVALPAVAAPKESTQMTWADMDMDDVAPLTSSGALVPNYELPSDHTPPPERGDTSQSTPEQQAFIGLLDSVYEIYHDSMLFSQVISNLMQDMKQNPDFMALMADEDGRILVKGMREALGLARQQKASRQKKAAPSAAKRKNSVISDDAFSQALLGAGINL